MRRSSFILFIALLMVVSGFASGPADRQPTDPKSISSPASPNAKPVPIDDLFYSRRVGDLDQKKTPAFAGAGSSSSESKF